jgi:phosphoribosylanthranilate isomerase
VKVWTKICGITRVDDAIAAASFGADAIGINFHPGSARYCAPEHAAPVAEALRGSGVTVYGVFVRESPRRIVELVRSLALSGVQLHGEESDAEAELVRDLLADEIEMIRAVAVTSAEKVHHALARAVSWRVLLDSARGGGSGTTFDERLIDGVDVSEAIVAGGLTPANVGAVVARLHPYGVDTAGGVERERGVKDHERMREFIEHANAGVA